MLNNIRSSYLVHWTGKDIQTDINGLNDSERKKYIERFEGTIEEGLWMTKSTDIFDIGSDGSSIKMEMNSVTCFTELKPTVSFSHIKRYGLLGFGFSKDFILIRHGSPVLYLNTNSVATTTSILKRLLYFTKSYSDSFNDVQYLLSLCKPMESEKINNMEEMEWRIIHTNENTDNIFKTKMDNPKSKIPFSVQDLKLLIVPDQKTKHELFQSSIFKKWILNNEQYVTIITIEELTTI